MGVVKSKSGYKGEVEGGGEGYGEGDWVSLLLLFSSQLISPLT